MTTDKAKEIFEGIKGYENTMDLIENHSVSVQDACAIGINAIEEVNRYKKAIEEIKGEILSFRGEIQYLRRAENLWHLYVGGI